MAKVSVDFLHDVLSNFAIAGEFVDATPYGNGHINDTFACRFRQESGVRRYILQRINHHVFTKPDELMDNISRVTTHVRAKLVAGNGHDADRESLCLVPTHEGQSYYLAPDPSYWRSFNFVEDATTHDVVTDIRLAYEAARAFARYQKQLVDLPGSRLYETIPGFHYSPKRFADLQAAIDKDPLGRAKDCRAEIRFALAREDITGVIVSGLEDGSIPERITHNDTKINNVLIDNDSGKGICVIDLDTVMPGSVLYDFGDQVRTSVGHFEENEKDISKVYVDMALFEQLVDGYLSVARDFLVDREIELLWSAGRLITGEIGVRFLADYLQGDSYFKTSYPDENLDRTRTQLRFVAELEKQRKPMEAIVAKHRTP